MRSEPIRDPVTDHLLPPANAALLIVDYQPPQVDHIGSIDRQLLVDHIVRVARLGVTYGLPVVLSTVNVATGVNPPTIPGLKKVLAESEELDRTTINAWEEIEFRQAVEATGRRKLIMCAPLD